MSVGFGDRLARGANKASWGPLNVTKEQWEAAFAPAEPESEPKAVADQQAEQVSHVRVGIK